MNKIILFLVISFLIPNNCYAAKIYNEKYYQNEWAQKWGGVQEYKLKDGTRVDVVTKNYAVEFDFAPKWAEAFGQSLHYAKMTNKKPAIILIIEKPKDFKYYYRLKALCDNYNVKLWYVKGVFYNAKISSILDIFGVEL